MNIPHILLTNDDGVDAKGIRILAELLSNFADVLVMAPDGARSGAACSITPHTPLCYKKKSEYSRIQVYACSGTPVDCIKLALEQFPDFKPDVIVSGVNHGDNASVSVHYSGTMGAVLEGCMKGYSSVGFSICDFSSDADFSAIGIYVQDIVQWVLEKGLPKDVCLNVNFPKNDGDSYRGIKVCRMARGSWTSEWYEAQHPAGKKYYWLTGRFVNLEPESVDTDMQALENGYVAVTPIKVDMTAHHVINELKELEKL
ncbi:MAG: 5'/3'-nucleotidase SurE [Paraprevotella sp.]|nr:5'/3'-nucleotidase SurE [Paraprevotella sp.]